MRISDLDRTEQLALAGLIRVLVQLDGRLSPEEIAELTPIANELGRGDFWKLLTEAARLVPDVGTAKIYAEQVQRRDVQVWMHRLLRRVAEADRETDPEGELLRWLTRTWQIR